MRTMLFSAFSIAFALLDDAKISEESVSLKSVFSTKTSNVNCVIKKIALLSMKSELPVYTVYRYNFKDSYDLMKRKGPVVHDRGLSPPSLIQMSTDTEKYSKRPAI